MDRELKLVFQEIYDAVVSHSKLPTVKRLTCLRAYSPALSSVVKLVNVNLDSILVEGRGLHSYNPERQNSIVLNFHRAHNTDLPLQAVQVHFSRLGAEVVDMKCGGGTVEIIYRATGTDVLGLTVTIYDQIVSESIAELTVSFDFPGSTVLSDLSVGSEVDAKFTEWLPGKTFELLFRSSRDGPSAASFHAACDREGPTVTLIKSSGGYVFGGYAGVPWSSPAGYIGTFHVCPSAFLFTVTNPHGDPITRFMSNGDGHAVRCGDGFGPAFGYGSDLFVSGAFNDESYTNFPHSYIDTRGRGEVTFAGGRDFTPAEVEVWAVE